MARLHCLCLLIMPLVLGQKTPGITNGMEAEKDNVKAADIKEIHDNKLNSLHALPEDTVKVTELKGIPETKLHALPEDTVKVAGLKAIQENKLRAHPEDKDISVIVKQKVDKPLQVTEVKLLAQPGEMHASFKKTDNRNMLKFKKRRPKRVKKKNGNSIKKTMLIKEQLKQKQLRKGKVKKTIFNRKKQLSRKLRNKAKKQTRKLNTDKLNAIIKLIHSHQKRGGSKLSTKYIKQQIVNLLNGRQLDRLAEKPTKGCAKPKSEKRKTRKRLRNTSKTKPSKGNPNKKSVVLAETQEISKAKDIGHEKEVMNVIKAMSKKLIEHVKARKGKVKSKINVHIQRKNDTSKTTEKNK